MYREKPTIIIDIKGLLEVASDDSERDYLELERQVRELYHDVFRYQKYGANYLDNVVCYNDGSNLIGYFRPCYEDFIKKLAIYLNLGVEPFLIGSYELDKKFKERLEVLKSIKSPSELCVEFPVIYGDFLRGREMRNELDLISRDSDDQEQYYQDRRHDYFSYGFKWNFKRFIETQSEMYKRFVDRRYELLERINETSFNPYLRGQINLDLLAMYVVDGYLNLARDTTNLVTRRTYLRLVERYFSSDYNKNVTVNLKNRFIDYTIIKRRYNDLMQTVREKDGYAEWELIPDGYEKVVVSHEGSKTRKMTVNSEKVERWREIGHRNQEFYDSSNYLARVVGVSKYSGYVGYIYPNGRVLLDREYHEEAPSSAVGNAIFYMKAIDFEALSRLDKTRLKNHPKVGRITHQGNWEDKAKEVIDEVLTEEDELASIVLIKKLKK